MMKTLSTRRVGLNPWLFWRPVYNFTWAKWQQSSYRHFGKWTEKQKGLKILDLGTGTGDYIRYLGKDNYYIFTEPDKQSINQAKKQAARYLKVGQYEFRLGYAEEILQKTEPVDVISMLHVISVVPNPNAVIKLCLKKIKKGGALLIYLNTRRKLSMGLKIFNPIFRPLGFRVVDLNKLLPNRTEQQICPFNTCHTYHVK